MKRLGSNHPSPSSPKLAASMSSFFIHGNLSFNCCLDNREIRLPSLCCNFLFLNDFLRFLKILSQIVKFLCFLSLKIDVLWMLLILLLPSFGSLDLFQSLSLLNWDFLIKNKLQSFLSLLLQLSQHLCCMLLKNKNYSIN